MHTVVAYYPISKPKQYSTIGSGTGYYIRTRVNNNEMIYGFGLQPANWVGSGYKSVDKAIIAARRMKKLDIEEGYVRDEYDVLDGNGNLVGYLNKNKIK